MGVEQGIGSPDNPSDNRRELPRELNGIEGFWDDVYPECIDSMNLTSKGRLPLETTLSSDKLDRSLNLDYLRTVHTNPDAIPRPPDDGWERRIHRSGKHLQIGLTKDNTEGSPETGLARYERMTTHERVELSYDAEDYHDDLSFRLQRPIREGERVDEERVTDFIEFTQGTKDAATHIELFIKRGDSPSSFFTIKKNEQPRE